MKLTIGKAAKEIGVTVVTLREWEKSGKVSSERTKGGHRRFDLETVLGCASLRKDTEKVTLIYARVSTPSR